MKAKNPSTTAIVACSVGLLCAQALASDQDNALFSYTHVQPGPGTLPAGRLIYGTEVALGVTDFLQIGTNVLRDAYQFWNANAKVSLVDTPVFALSLTAGWEHYNLNNIDRRNPDLKVTSFLPGVVTAVEVLPRLALISGANLSFTRTDVDEDALVSSGYTRGARVGSDLSWAYNAGSRKRGVGNVASAGVTYDFSYELFGFGISHHWPGFHLGIHYYPNADQYKVQPILSGGGTMSF